MNENEELIFSYFDSSQDRIFIESDEDLILAYDLCPKELKILLKKQIKPQGKKDSKLTGEHLDLFGQYLEDKLGKFNPQIK